MLPSNLKFVTSNEEKLEEYRSYGLRDIRIEKGKDLREVVSDPMTVAIYKALEAGDGHIIEDSSLTVENSNIGIDIKFRLRDLEHHISSRAIFRVLLGVNYRGIITIYAGEVYGHITKPDHVELGTKVFGFDNHFTPVGSDANLYRLQLQGRKHLYSPRSIAVASLLRGEHVKFLATSTVPPWRGKYQ